MKRRKGGGEIELRPTQLISTSLDSIVNGEGKKEGGKVVKKKKSDEFSMMNGGGGGELLCRVEGTG